MILIQESSIKEAIQKTQEYLKNAGRTRETKNWQSIQAPRAMHSVKGVVINIPLVPRNILDLSKEVNQSSPWAEIHFQERVSRQPLNPGESYRLWPYYGRDEKMRNQKEKFSHTYMERFWPKFSKDEPNSIMEGIRYQYGDLDDVVNLLKDDPTTRQAYLPIYFPEDTGTVHKQRVPCSLGYLFSFDKNYLDLTYFMRSCDFLRHFRDDIYLAIRLQQWVLQELQRIKPEDFTQKKLGGFTMYIEDLHIFDIEKNRI